MFFALLFLVPTVGHVLVIPTIVRKGTVWQQERERGVGSGRGGNSRKDRELCWGCTSLGAGLGTLKEGRGPQGPFYCSNKRK